MTCEQLVLGCSFSLRDQGSYLVDSYYLKPAANILQIPKGTTFFFLPSKTSEQPYIELAHQNWITDSLVFSAQRYDVISWLFLRYLFALSLSCAVFAVFLLCCAVTRGTNPWPTVLVFLLSQGWRSIPFKCSQLWLKLKIMIHWINAALCACVCWVVDKQILRKFINLFILS